MCAAIQLSSENHDFDLVPASAAHAEAQLLADVLGVAITLRHPLTDAVLAAVQPAAQRSRTITPIWNAGSTAS